MPTLKKYSGIKACEDMIQRGTLGSGNAQSVRKFTDVDGNDWTNLIYSYTANQQYATAPNIKYLSCDSVKASADDYNKDDYNGTYTGTCQFNVSRQTGGVSYQVQFTANESATIKCLKFFKSLYVSGSSGYESKNVLMFAIYFDSPISVVSGDILNMSVNFAYDDQQVTII